MGKHINGRTVMWIGVGLSAIALLFPPWQLSLEMGALAENPDPPPAFEPAGRSERTKLGPYRLIFLPPKVRLEVPDDWQNVPHYDARIDVARMWPPLALGILIAAAGMVSVLAYNRNKRHRNDEKGEA